MSSSQSSATAMRINHLSMANLNPLRTQTHQLNI